MTQPLALPARLKSLYEKSTHRAAADLAQQSFMHWLDNFTQPLTFFPEYTDHGRPHLESVLTSAEALITEDSWNLLTADDAVLFVLAVLLHDAAMALTEDQFLALLQDPTSAPTLNPNHPEKTFSALFDDFLAEARRWDGRKIINVLGNSDPKEPNNDDPISYIQHPNKLGFPEKWTKRHRRFLGEFLRLHHPRLAHHFALHGLPKVVPTPSSVLTTAPSLPAALPQHLKDLAGLIARSHGIPLRDTFSYFQKFGKNIRAFTHNTHPIYLMAVLRIADFLQIDHTRGTDLSAVRKLRSPLSELHWNAQAAIEDATWDEEDSEALNFTAVPHDARTFLHLQELLRGSHGLQQELDTTWATLGQTFSRLTKVGKDDLSKFGLTLRRVMSNIDDPEDFVRNYSPNYYPYEAKFDAAGADLLKILIKPLYGDRPEIGVRELLQNAVDAVRELEYYFHSNGRIREWKPRVSLQVKKENGHYYFVISDNGIGMTRNTLLHYFLKAGASIRTSDNWRRNFSPNGESMVLRSGRFGVGALAAFILGPTLEMTTRYAIGKNSEGLRLRASLDDENVELHRDDSAPFGTTIRIRLPETILTASGEIKAQQLLEQPEADWYSLSIPNVKILTEKKTLTPRHKLPQPNADLPLTWFRMHVPDYEDIHWTYSFAPYISCNGIRIGPPVDKRNFNPWNNPLCWGQNDMPLPVPCLSVFDRNFAFPINLQRDRLQADVLPFTDRLIESIVDAYCSFLLVHAPTNYAEVPRFTDFGPSADIIEFFHSGKLDMGECFIMQLPTGTTVPLPPIADRLGIEHLLWYPTAASAEDAHGFLKNASKRAVCWMNTPDNDAHPALEKLALRLVGRDKMASQFGATQANVMLPTRLLDSLLLSGSDLDKTDTFISGCHGMHLLNFQLSSGKNQSRFNEYLTNDMPRKRAQILIAAEWEIQTANCQKTVFANRLLHLLPDPVIPYDLDARRRKFAYAYEKLADLIIKWEAWNR